MKKVTTCILIALLISGCAYTPEEIAAGCNTWDGFFGSNTDAAFNARCQMLEYKGYSERIAWYTPLHAANDYAAGKMLKPYRNYRERQKKGDRMFLSQRDRELYRQNYYACQEYADLVLEYLTKHHQELKPQYIWSWAPDDPHVAIYLPSTGMVADISERVGTLKEHKHTHDATTLDPVEFAREWERRGYKDLLMGSGLQTRQD